MTFTHLSQGGDNSRNNQGRNGTHDVVTRAQSQSVSISNMASPLVPQKGEKNAKGNNVSALVAKSKKAAASLYTLLHAKVRHYCPP